MSPAIAALLLACLLCAPVAAVIVVVVAFIVPNPLKAVDAWLYPRLDGLPDPTPLTLRGPTAAWIFEPDAPRASVLVCHGRSRSKRWMLPLIASLLPDYRVLAIDFPGHGESPGTVCTLGLREADAVNTALDWLEQFPGPIHVYGVSMGGVAAVLALAGTSRTRVASLITDGSFDTLERVYSHLRRWIPLPRVLLRWAFVVIRRLGGFDPLTVRPVDRATHITVPWLVLHGDRDPLVPPAAAAALAAACPTAALVYYRGGHDQPRNAEMQHLVRTFLRDTAACAPQGGMGVA